MESQSTPFYRHIAQELQRSSFLNSFTQNLLEGKTRLQYSHLNLSARALLIAHAREQTGKNVLVITPDDLLAEDYWDDFCVLSGRENAHYLPDFEVLPYEERSPHYSIRATRLETIAHTVSDNPQIYTLSMRTLLRWMQPFELLQKNILTLRKGMEIDPAVLISDLVGMGYESDYQVSKVYQFAKRGGILDIFSPPQTKPFRLEFFGDEIVSVRSFSLSTQRSDAGELEQVTIIPARELSLHDISVDSPLLERVHDQGFFEGIENCIGLL